MEAVDGVASAARLAPAYGVGAYAAFVGVIGYYALFVTGLVVPKTVDSGAGLAGPAALVDVALVAAFGLQHSAMARTGLKRRLGRLLPGAVERSTYVLASAAILALVLAGWRPITALVWQFRGPAAAVACMLCAGGVLLALVATFAFGHAELFGLAQTLAVARHDPLDAQRFRVPPLYRVVRHPMHLGMLVLLWAAPTMTAGHLLLASAMTGYVLVGIHFEERDLVRQFGDAYRRYQGEVPALIPLRLRSQRVARSE